MAKEKDAESGQVDLPTRVKAITGLIQEYYCTDKIPWVIGYSGGKDSTAVLQLVWYALSALPAERRHKRVYVITTDTLVEQPVVASWVKLSLEKIREAAPSEDMPFEPHLLYPEMDQTFWVNLIGRGYPAPRHKFRWCTERMKIMPSNRFIRSVVRQNGEAMLVLGTRKTESSRRAATMAKHEEKRLRDRISPNSKLPNSLLFSPIEDWTSDDVWMYLMQVQNPWGHSNRDLVSMYRGASADNECPLVVDTTTPSCGNSRFGCWVCTMVERDRSMEAMIQNDEEKEWMLPLLELRNELANKDDKHIRDFRRLSGHVQLFHDEPIHGPYTKDAREEWLRRVLTTQTELREDGPEYAKTIELIQLDELREIRRIWRSQKHEFDDSLPRIYEECTGEPYPTELEHDEVLGPAEWEVLREVCDGDELMLDLAAHLLDTEREYLTKSRRVGVYKELEKILRVRGYESKEQAIDSARRRRTLKAGEPDQQIDLLRDAGRAK